MLVRVSPRKLYNFYIDPELAAGLKELKARHGTPEGESIRRALAVYLQSQGAMKKTERKRVPARKRP
jgi:hypothetical protein